MSKKPANRKTAPNPNPKPNPNRNIDDFPNFFKIYLPQLYSHRMRIPPAFVKNFEGNPPKKVILRNARGRIWRLTMEKINRYFYSTESWERFVADNSLEYGEFLVFAYDRSGLFEVKIFGLDCCKKHDLVTNEKVAACANGHRAVKVEKELMDEPCTDKPANNGFHQRDAPPDTYQWVKTLKAITYEQNIPSEASRHCDITPDSTMIFCSPNGIVQIVRIMRRSDGRVIAGRGWKEFCMKSNILAGDECEFKVVFGKEKEMKEFLVQVVS